VEQECVNIILFTGLTWETIKNVLSLAVAKRLAKFSISSFYL